MVGKRLASRLDQFTSPLNALVFGKPRLGLLDREPHLERFPVGRLEFVLQLLDPLASAGKVLDLPGETLGLSLPIGIGGGVLFEAGSSLRFEAVLPRRERFLGRPLSPSESLAGSIERRFSFGEPSSELVELPGLAFEPPAAGRVGGDRLLPFRPKRMLLGLELAACP